MSSNLEQPLSYVTVCTLILEKHQFYANQVSTIKSAICVHRWNVNKDEIVGIAMDVALKEKPGFAITDKLVLCIPAMKCNLSSDTFYTEDKTNGSS